MTPDDLLIQWKMQSKTRIEQANIGTMGRSRIWKRLDVDAHTYRTILDSAPPIGRMALLPLAKPDEWTEGQTVANYVTTMMPELDPFDWWWVKEGDRIVISVRKSKLDEIRG